MDSSEHAAASVPSSLRIRFSAGERPYVFAVSPWIEASGERCRFKVLSKCRTNGSVEILALRDEGGARRKTVAYFELPAPLPSGWLEHWIDTLANELATEFDIFDLRAVRSADEWREVALRLGWSTRGAQTS